jgi:hypothetical protein
MSNKAAVEAHASKIRALMPPPDQEGAGERYAFVFIARATI